MNADQHDRAAEISARYACGPSRIAGYLQRDVGELISLFDQQSFQDDVKRREDEIIKHAMVMCQGLNLDYQATMRQFRDGSHSENIQRARQLLYRVDESRRWP